MNRNIDLTDADDFLLYIKTQNYSAETIYNYEQDLKQLQNFLVEEKISFSDLSKQNINRFKVYLTSRERKQPFGGTTAPRKLEPRSINRILSSLRSYLKYLIEMDKPVPIPPDAIHMVKTDKKHGQVAELHDLVRLVEYPETSEKNSFVGMRNRCMLEVLLATGMRISELVSLNRDQLDGTGKLFVRGKGRKERFVYLTDRAIKILEKYLSVRQDTCPAMFVSLRGANAGKATNRVSPNYLQMKIKEYKEKLRIIVPTSAHSLRHGFATYLAESGANPAAIQILLGHESLDTTTRYVHASDKFAQETHTKFHPLK
jgi:site-specific recombinase XerD